MLATSGYPDSNHFFLWQPDHAPAYIAAILIVMISFNLFGVQYFGESEFYFCLVKSEIFTHKNLRISLKVHDFLQSPSSLFLSLPVSSLPSVVALTTHEEGSNTGRIPVPSHVLDWSITLAPIGSWPSCQYSYRLRSASRVWNSSLCTSFREPQVGKKPSLMPRFYIR